MGVGSPPVPPLLEAMQGPSAGRHGERQATAERDGEGPLRRLTYNQLSAQVAATANLLRERGVRPGDVVAVWLPNWTEAIVWEFALAGLGAASLGVNTRYSVHELTNLLTRGRPVGVVLPASFLGLDFAGRLRTAWQAAAASPDASPPWVATARGRADDPTQLDLGTGVWEAPGVDAAPVAADDTAERVMELYPERLVNFFTTSGSSGDPKLAGHSQESVALHARNVARAFELDADCAFLAALPLTGVFGFNPAMATLAAGGCCLLEPVFDVSTVLADMQEVGVTHVVGGDDMLGRLMDGWDAATMKPTVRRGGIADFVGRSGAFVAWAEQEWEARIGGVYGSSEIFSLAATWPAEVGLPERARGGGVPVSDAIEVRVADPQSGELRPPGEMGELQFRGYNVLDAYLGTPELLAEARTGDGWFRSGDLGQMTGERDGSFVYVCRNSDALRLRGFLVEPDEIERFLMSHPAVETARVVGVAGGSGDVAAAFVKLTPAASAGEAELLEYCRGQLAPFKVPSLLEIIDEFPVTVGTNGTKIKTGELRRRAAEKLEGRA